MARAVFYELSLKKVQFLRIVTAIEPPLLWCHTSLAGESAIENTWRRKAATLGYVLHGPLGVFSLHPFSLVDTTAVDKLIERTTILGVDKMAEVGAVEWQYLTQVCQLKIRIKVRFLLIEPCFQGSTIGGIQRIDLFRFLRNCSAQLLPRVRSKEHALGRVSNEKITDRGLALPHVRERSICIAKRKSHRQ